MKKNWQEINFNLLNAKQLAVKISANSVGGNTPIPCLSNGQIKYRGNRRTIFSEFL